MKVTCESEDEIQGFTAHITLKNSERHGYRGFDVFGKTKCWSIAAAIRKIIPITQTALKPCKPCRIPSQPNCDEKTISMFLLHFPWGSYRPCFGVGAAPGNLTASVILRSYQPAMRVVYASLCYTEVYWRFPWKKRWGNWMRRQEQRGWKWSGGLPLLICKILDRTHIKKPIDMETADRPIMWGCEGESRHHFQHPFVLNSLSNSPN